MRKIIAYILITAAVVAGGATFKGISMQSKMRYYCVAQWPFDEDAADTTVEDSIGSYDGTASKNTEDMNAIGKINGALDFNGDVNDYIDLGDETIFTPTTSGFSVSAWVYMETLPCMYIAYKKYEWLLEVDEWSVGWALIDNNTPEDTGNLSFYGTSMQSTFDGNWTHIVGTWNGGTELSGMKAYVNGVEISQGESSAKDEPFYYPRNTNNNFYIGNDPCDSSYRSKYLDNVTIHNKALSQVEIDWLYNGGDGREL